MLDRREAIAGISSSLLGGGDAEVIAALQKLEARITTLEEQLNFLSQTSPPIGAIVAFMGEWLPNRLVGKPWTENELGWLLCDGRGWNHASLKDIPAEDLKYLRDLIGGEGLPDLRGVFLRGLDFSKFNDSSNRDKLDGGREDRKIGTLQAFTTAKPKKAFKTDKGTAHEHIAPTQNGEKGNFEVGGGLTGVDFDNGHPTAGGGHHTHEITDGGDAETRPVNVAVNYIIKFRAGAPVPKAKAEPKPKPEPKSKRTY